MVLAFFFICGRDDGLRLNGVDKVGPAGPFSSGKWNISEEEARSLVGGWLYLHPRKSDASDFGGVIKSYGRVKDDTLARSRRTVFIVQRHKSGDGQPWRGKRHGMAHSGTPVPADLPHETKTTDAGGPRGEKRPANLIGAHPTTGG